MKHLGDQDVNGEVKVNNEWDREFGSSGTRECEMIRFLEQDIKFMTEQKEVNFFIKRATRSP